MGEPGSPGAVDDTATPRTAEEPDATGTAEEPDRLETWTVATFNVVAFGLVLVLAGYATGALSEILPDVGTVPGIAVFAYLWALVVVATRTGLPAGGLATIRTDGVSPVLIGGVVAGTITGAGFVLGVVLVAVLPLAVTEGMKLDVLIPLAGLMSLGTGVGGVVGALLGATFATLNVALYVTARTLVPDL